jgi:hypothetical protein
VLLVTDSVYGIPLRAPRGNNLAAIVPDRSTLAALLQANLTYWNSSQVPSWIGALRFSARRQLAAAARDHTLSYLTSPQVPSSELSEDRPWILGGHQAELFHPGVWFKNILIDRLAKETNSVGLHAIIDHDLARVTTMRVPLRKDSRQRAHVTTIPLPLLRPSTPDTFLPWNAWQVDRSRIEDTCRKIRQALGSVGITRSMSTDYFHQVASLPEDRNAAIALSQVRHRMERRHGVSNWEFPMSHLCKGTSWRVFVDHCVANAVELNRIYNECLDDYRSREQITNPAQPVPRLGCQDEWIELPFWIRLPGQFSRKRMWVSKRGSGCLVAPEPGSNGPTVSWGDPFWESSWIVWPRALTTTLFLRVFIADLFIHGIGGGQYDRLTDAIIERFLHIPPPKFVTCTATLWLTFPRANSIEELGLPEQATALERQRQRLRSGPEQFLDLQIPAQKQLAIEHRQLLDRMPPRGLKKPWDHEVRALKARIVAAVHEHFHAWDDLKTEFEARTLEQKILQSREFSYVLFEEQDILDRLLQLSLTRC